MIENHLKKFNFPPCHTRQQKFFPGVINEEKFREWKY